MNIPLCGKPHFGPEASRVQKNAQKRRLADVRDVIPPTSGSSRLDEALREAAMRDPLLDPRTDRERLAAVRDILRRHFQKKTRLA